MVVSRELTNAGKHKIVVKIVILGVAISEKYQKK